MSFWFFMCLSPEGHIRVSTLRNHLKQNNEFTRCFLHEMHLPVWQRLGWKKRFMRLVAYLLLVMTMTSNICMLDLTEIGARSARRVKCRQYCQETHFPSLYCKDIEDETQIQFQGGSLYDNFFFYQIPSILSKTNIDNYRSCMYFALSPDEEGEKSKLYASERTDVCFTLCRRSKEKPFDIDKRDPCPVAQTQEEYSNQFENMGKEEALNSSWLSCNVAGGETCDLFYAQGLYCVSEKDAIDNPISEEDPMIFCFGDRDGGNESWCISIVQILIVVGLSDVVFFFMDALFFVAADIDDNADFVQASLKFACETTIILVYTSLILLMMGPIQQAYYYGKEEAIWVTWIIAVFFDQLKSFCVQPLVWILIIRRCGRVQPGIQEYNEEYLTQWELAESLMEELRRLTREFLNWGSVKFVMTRILIGFYSIFIIISIAFWPSDETILNILIVVDLIFLTLFMVEIVCKVFAFGSSYTKDYWNLFDALVVIGALIAAIWLRQLEEPSGILPVGLLRLINVVRKIMVIRRVSEGRKKLKRIKKATTGYEVSSHVDNVLELVDELQIQGCIPQYLKEDLEWFTEIIVCNKLYKVSVDMQSQDKKNCNQKSAWIEVADGNKGGGVTAPAPNPGGSMARSGIRFTSQTRTNLGVTSTRVSASSARRRTSEQQNRPQGDESAQLSKQLYARSHLSQGEEGQIESTLKPLDEWTFDMLMAAEVLDVNVIPIIFLKLGIAYEYVQNLNVDFELLFNYCTKVQENAKSEVKFHGAAHTCSMMQACHYFILHGLDAHLPCLEKFTLQFACMVAYDSHPGLTNSFLVMGRHPTAIRYNDQNVLQSYNLSRAFTSLQDPELNFFVHVDTGRVENFRKTLISIILKLDIRHHFEKLSLFKTKLASDFPLPNNEEDKQVLMAISLRMADYSWTCRPLQNYLRWSEKFFEELFQQGDVEKQMGLPVSPFCDKDSVNTSKCQLGYLMVIVQPLAVSYAVFLNDPQVQRDVTQDGLEANRAHLKSWVG